MHVVNMSIRVNCQGLQLWTQMRKELLTLKLGFLVSDQREAQISLYVLIFIITL
jgi:hypothetical protein